MDSRSQPQAMPGQVISASLVQGLQDAAERSRFVAVGDGLSMTRTPTTLNIGTTGQPLIGQFVLISVDGTYTHPATGANMGGGIYQGKIYSQPVMLTNTKNDLEIENPNPNIVRCIVINSPENGKPTHRIKSQTALIGRFAGLDQNSWPIVLVDHLPDDRMGIVKWSGGSDGTPSTYASWTYDLYSLNDVGYLHKLNLAGALQPQCSRARIVKGPVTKATDGSVAELYYDVSGAIQLWNCQELHGSGGC